MADGWVFYRPGDDHGLPGNPFNSLITPRPIGWISTRSKDGVDNLAPYSFFNGVAYSPPQVMFAATSGHRTGGYKDSVLNAIDTGQFVVNLATWDQREAMNASCVAAPRDVDEFEYAGLEKLPSTVVDAPRVKGSPAQLECEFTQSVRLPSEDGDENTVVFGTVVGVHIDERVLTGGRVDPAKLQMIGRLGGQNYVAVREVFEMVRPDWTE